MNTRSVSWLLSSFLMLGLQIQTPSMLAESPIQAGRKDIPSISRDALKAVVLIVVSDSAGKEIKQGSGVVVSDDGKIVTNYHVIDGASSAMVKFPNGAFYLVDGILATDKERDIAVLKAAGTDFPTVPLGNSDEVQIGEDVVSIGSPLSLEASVSNGIISSVRDLKDDKQPLIQTTAPISHGSSGGALLNMRGEIIGITTAQMTGGQNLNFAVPINVAKPLLLRSSVSKFGESTGVSESGGGRSISRLGDIRTIAVAPLGTTEAANIVHEKLVNRLARSGQVVLVEDTEQADAVLNGFVGQNAYTGYAETGAFRLVDKHGHILWSDETGRGGGFGSASSHMADKVADNLASAIEKDRKRSN